MENLERLIHDLRSPDSWVNSRAAKALGSMGGPTAIASLISALRDPDWYVRYVAAKALREIGDSKAVPHFIVAANDEYSGVRKIAVKALGEFRRQLPRLDRESASSVLCPQCFCRFKGYQAKLGLLKNLSCFLCPDCYGCSFIDNVTKVVAVLDHSLDKPYLQDGSTLRANWYSRREPFDFEEIRVVDADDFDIDELVMKLRNDMDDRRRKRCKSLPVYLSSHLHLSQAKMHMLKDTFGRVETIK